jgi:peptidyl-prolyl cis-trans isomerase D
MLNGMRRSAKHILWPLIIALVITMGGYGVWYLVRPEATQSAIGAIWGEPVRLEEFIQAARVVRAVALLGGREPERSELYMSAWRNLLLRREAERMGVSASRRDLARFLAQWPVFQVDGRFNPDRYSRVLAGLGLDSATFEKQIENLLANELMGTIIRNQALVSPAEVENTYRRLNEEIRVEYARVGVEESPLLQDVPEAEMEEYYRDNRAQFQVQTEIEIDYLLVEVDDFTDPSPEEEDPEPGPEESSPEAETGRTAAEEAAAERADAISRMLDYEDSLAKPAQEYGLEIRNSGYFSPGEELPGVGPVPEIERLAWAMETGVIASYPVPVPDGFLIFQLTGIKEARQRDFEESRKEIRKILLAEKQREETFSLAREKLLEIRDLMDSEERDFASAAEGVDLETETTSFFTRQGGDDLPPVPRFATAAFLTPPDEVSDLIPGEDGFFFLSVLERKPPPPMPEDEKEEWLESARRTRADLLYEAWFSHLVRQSGFSITNEEFAP